MYVDLARSCYSTLARLRPGGPPSVINWHFAAENALPLPIPTRINSLNWHPDSRQGRTEGDKGTIGEVPGAPRNWRSGARPAGLSGQRYFGQPDAFRLGTHGVNQPLPVGVLRCACSVRASFSSAIGLGSVKLTVGRKTPGMGTGSGIAGARIGAGFKRAGLGVGGGVFGTIVGAGFKRAGLGVGGGVFGTIVGAGFRGTGIGIPVGVKGINQNPPPHFTRFGAAPGFTSVVIDGLH